MKSMTGFGSARGVVNGGQFSAAVRCLNHRYREIFVRLPPLIAELEPAIRQVLCKWFLRGRVEVTVVEERMPEFERKVMVDKKLALEHQKRAEELARMWGVDRKLILQYLNPKDYFVPVFTYKIPNRCIKEVNKIIEKACKGADAMRRREGKVLERDQRLRLNKLEKMVEKLDRQSKASLASKVEVIRKKMTAIGVSEQQVAGEELALINRQDVSEEITRLKSHIEQYLRLLGGELIGRQLDFLLQEMLREVTTLSAKACDHAISSISVACKAEIERLREQVQNIE